MIEQGYQARTFVDTFKGQKAIVKRVKNPSLPIVRRIQRWMLRREANALRELDDLEGVPAFLGYPDEHSIAMEFREGRTLRDVDEFEALSDVFFDELSNIVTQMHERGVVHSDLKKKENVIVSPTEKPVLIDFGSSLQRKPSWHVVNNFVFDQFRVIDRHAVLKYKYRGYSSGLSDDERREVMDLVFLEKLSRWGRHVLPFRMNPPPLSQRYD